MEGKTEGQTKKEKSDGLRKETNQCLSYTSLATEYGRVVPKIPGLRWKS